MPHYWEKGWHEVYYETAEEAADRKERTEFKKWFRRTSLSPLGERGAKIAREEGYKDINVLREDMISDLEGTLFKILRGYSSKSARSRHTGLRILEALEIRVPPKIQVTCKCCGQDIPQKDAIDLACEAAKDLAAFRRLSY